MELKRLHTDAVPAALEKAEHYRLLNEPRAAESICLDILEIDSANQRARITLLLARTDQFVRVFDQCDQAVCGSIVDLATGADRPSLLLRPTDPRQ